MCRRRAIDTACVGNADAVEHVGNAQHGFGGHSGDMSAPSTVGTAVPPSYEAPTNAKERSGTLENVPLLTSLIAANSCDPPAASPMCLRTGESAQRPGWCPKYARLVIS